MKLLLIRLAEHGGIERARRVKAALTDRYGKVREDVLVEVQSDEQPRSVHRDSSRSGSQETPIVHTTPMSLSYVLHAGPGNLLVDLLLVIQIVADRVMNLGSPEVRKGLHDLVDAVAPLPQDGDLQHGKTCSRDGGGTPANCRIANNMRMFRLDVHGPFYCLP